LSSIIDPSHHGRRRKSGMNRSTKPELQREDFAKTGSSLISPLTVVAQC
jgi:hypothetical protein